MTACRRLPIFCRVMLALAGLFMTSGFANGKTGGYFDGKDKDANAVLDRWVKVQGIDRSPDILLPRVCELEMKFDPDEVPIKLRCLVGKMKAYRLEVQLQDGTRRIEFSPGNERNVWVWSESLGTGKMDQPSEIAKNLFKASRSVEAINLKYASWRLLPDTKYDGRVVNVVLMETMEGYSELWFFDSFQGTLVRIGPPLNWPKSDENAITWNDFRLIDGVLEPFEMKMGAGKKQVTQRISRIINHAKMAGDPYKLPEKAYQQWQKTEKVIERYVTACGGEANLSQIVSRVTKLKGNVVTSGVTFDVTISQKLPDLVIIERNTAGVGRSWEGYDGKTAWASGEIEGFRTLHRDEMKVFVQNYDLHNTEENLARFFPMRIWRGEKEIDGRQMAVIELGTLSAKAGTYYFDVETGQRVRVESVIVSNEGSLPITMDFADFRTVDGITMPYTMTMVNPAMRVVTTVESVQHNMDIPDEVFRKRTEE